MKVVTKCWRVCSPSPMTEMPARNWSSTARRIASALACSSASPESCQGAQSFSGWASQAGLGRLPAMAVAIGWVKVFSLFRVGRVRRETAHAGQRMTLSSSTSKFSVAFGGTAAPAPREP